MTYIPGRCDITFVFVIAMMPLNHIVRKCTGGYKLHKLQEKNQLPKEDWQHQTVCQKWERIGNPNTGSVDIQLRYRDGICHRKMYYANNEKRHWTKGIELTNLDKIRTLGEMEIFKYFGISETDTIKQAEMKEKIKREYLRRPTKILKTKLHYRNFIKGINIWALPVLRYAGLFLKWDERRISTKS